MSRGAERVGERETAVERLSGDEDPVHLGKDEASAGQRPSFELGEPLERAIVVDGAEPERDRLLRQRRRLAPGPHRVRAPHVVFDLPRVLRQEQLPKVWMVR